MYYVTSYRHVNNCIFRSIEIELSKERFRHLFLYFVNNTTTTTVDRIMTELFHAMKKVLEEEK